MKANYVAVFACFVAAGATISGASAAGTVDCAIQQVAPPSDSAWRLPLRDGWSLRSSTQVSEDGETVSTARFRPDGWFPTAVPSTVLNALIKNGIYPDMRVGLNVMRIPDSSDEFNAKHDLAKYSHLPNKRNPWRDPYWFRTQFDLPRLGPGRRATLCFNMINYRADVWLNGKKIADRVDTVGIFQRYRFDITEQAVEGVNTLAVLIHPTDHPALPDTQLEVFGRDRNYQKEIMKDLTMVMTIGYDCMPTVPDRNMGILQDVYIEVSGPVSIRDPFVVTDLPLPATDRAALKITATLVNTAASPIKGLLRGSIEETGLTFEDNVELRPNETREITFSPQPVMENPRLWWPVNYGDQSLYDLHLEFRIGDVVSDKQVVRFGVREITKALHELDGSHGLQMHINGKRIFGRGGYIQPEVLLDWDAERMETEIRYFTQANLNLVYFEDIPVPPDAFLDLCDRYGLLIGNCFYGCYWMKPGSGFPDDVELLARGTKDILRRIRNHPSLILYMAMNEHDTREDVYEMWREQVLKLDGTRLIIPSGYFPDSRKDVPEWFKKDLPVGMTDIGASYTWKEPVWYYEKVRGDRNWMFMIESGSASLPPIDSLRRFIPDLGTKGQGAPFPLTQVWAHHGANHYYRDYDSAVRRLLGEPESVADYCRKGHVVTADQHRAMFEAVNHRMWDITSGFTQWKINACWPSVQWQIFDWYHRPMVSYYYIKRACEPVHVQLGLIEPTVTVINNRLEPRRDLEVTARVFDFDMNRRWEKSANVEIDANSCKDVFTIPSIEGLTPLYFVSLQLQDSSGKSVSDNFYWMKSDESPELAALQNLPLVTLNALHKTETKGEETIVHVTVANPTEHLAFFIHAVVLRGPGGEEVLPVFWDDNYFSLLPGESKRISATFATKNLGGAAPVVEVGGWNIRSRYECKSLDVSKTTVETNEPLVATARIANTFLDGSPVELSVDGRAVDSGLVWCRDGQEEKVRFPVELDRAGIHEIKVGGQTASVSVK